jgi:Tfp pilus assembly protein PilN
MEIEINVLPDAEKEKIKEEKKTGFSLRLVLGFVAVLILVNVVLYLMQIVLGIEYKAAKKASETSLSRNLGKENQLEKVFQETNAQVLAISRINAKLPNWARILVRISELCPEGIRTNHLAYDGTRLNLSGFAKSREGFIEFQNRLKGDGLQFSNDISNLVASKDFNFDLEITVPPDYLIRK